MNVRVHALEESIRTLGPFVRYVVWVQGCKKRCPGCMSPASRPLEGGVEMEVKALAEKIKASGRRELTISGGEPFLQAKALARLIDLLKETEDVGVIVYTGYTYEELLAQKDEAAEGLLARIDLLVDGEYVEECNDGKGLRGSSNQRAIPLTDRYLEYIKDYGGGRAAVEWIMREEGLRMVGIPTKEVLRMWEQIC